MTKYIAALKKLDRTLIETHSALNEVIRVLEETPTSFQGVTPTRRANFEAYFERYKQGEWLDQRYKVLWLRERELTAAYNDSQQSDKHEAILVELETLRQEMTEILQELYSED